MTLTEKLLQNFQELSEEKQRQTIDYIDFLRKKEEKELEAMIDNVDTKLRQPIDIDFATERAMHVRRLYHQLEQQNHKTVWTTQEDMLAYVCDVGILARLVMASEGRWLHEGDVYDELRSKITECLWWLLVLSNRLGIDVTEAFTLFMDKLDNELGV